MKHRMDPLPEGWFYNGCKYVSLGGERTDMHPGKKCQYIIHEAWKRASVAQELTDRP